MWKNTEKLTRFKICNVDLVVSRLSTRLYGVARPHEVLVLKSIQFFVLDHLTYGPAVSQRLGGEQTSVYQEFAQPQLIKLTQFLPNQPTL